MNFLINHDTYYEPFFFIVLIDIVPTIYLKLTLTDPGEVKRDFESEFERLQRDIEKKKEREDKLREDLMRQIEVIFPKYVIRFFLNRPSFFLIEYFPFLQAEEIQMRQEEEQEQEEQEEQEVIKDKEMAIVNWLVNWLSNLTLFFLVY